MEQEAGVDSVEYKELYFETGRDETEYIFQCPTPSSRFKANLITRKCTYRNTIFLRARTRLTRRWLDELTEDKATEIPVIYAYTDGDDDRESMRFNFEAFAKVIASQLSRQAALMAWDFPASLVGLQNSPAPKR
jgi:hypothetical protein